MLEFTTIRIFLVFLFGSLASAQPSSRPNPNQRPPNFLVFFCDNLGYGDISPYGSTLHRTPNLDRLAAESRNFTHFYTAANVCTPSRAGLITGTYPRRLNIYKNIRNGPVLQPGEPIGLNPSELATMMDILPTFAFLAGATPPGPEVIDGRNIWPLFAGDRNGRTPHEAFFYYQFEQLQAVRSGPWKLFVPLERQRLGPAAPLKTVNSPARLYHVVDDQAENRDIAASNPDVVARLLKLADRGKREVGDLDLPGRGERPAGWVFQPQTQQLPAQR